LAITHTFSFQKLPNIHISSTF